MPSHAEKRVLPYTSEQLFDLVMDIEKYPEFMPWCLAARINSSSKNELNADVIVGFKLLREKFNSTVIFKRAKSIEVEYRQGPMKNLQNRWAFKDVSGGKCEVDFYIEFSMKTKMLEALVDQFFYRVLVKMINSFETRAAELYGTKKKS